MPDLVLPLLAVDVQHDFSGDKVVRLQREVAPLQVLEPLPDQKLYREVSFSENKKKGDKSGKNTGEFHAIIRYQVDNCTPREEQVPLNNLPWFFREKEIID